MKHMAFRKLIVLLIATLFVISLTQDGFYTEQRNPADRAHPSIMLFLIGWMGVIDFQGVRAAGASVRTVGLLD